MATFTGWTAVNAPTLTAETTIKMHLTQSMKMAAGVSDGQVYQAITANIKEVATKTIHVRAWVYATAASAARIRVSFDGGSTFTDHAYHSGVDQWEVQELDVTVPSTATSIRVYLETVASGTAYFDLIRAWVDSTYRYTIPSAILKGPYTLSVQRNIDEPEGPFDPVDDFTVEEDSGTRYLILGHALTPGLIMRVTGIGVLSTMSSDSGTTEIDAPRTHLVVARAAQWLFENLAADSALEGREVYEAQAAKWEKKVAQLLATPGMRMHEMGARRNINWSYG